MKGETNVLVKNSEEVLKRLDELQLFSDRSIVDNSASKTPFHYINISHGTIDRAATYIHRPQAQRVGSRISRPDALHRPSVTFQIVYIHNKSIEV